MVSKQRAEAAAEKLALLATKAACDGAHRFLEVHGLEADPDQLAVAVREEVRREIDRALDDFARAVEVGMGTIGQATFVACLALAGVAAAKRVGRIADEIQIH